MVVAERANLTAVKTLISNSHLSLVLFENSEGNLFLSSDTDKPGGTVYYATTPSLLCMFFENDIDLQTLFDNTPSHFVEISTEDKSALYSRRNIDVELKGGNKSVRQLKSNCTKGVW